MVNQKVSFLSYKNKKFFDFLYFVKALIVFVYWSFKLALYNLLQFFTYNYFTGENHNPSPTFDDNNGNIYFNFLQ